MLEHRHVMEKMLGRKLVSGENVHHLDGQRARNDPANLELWNKAQPCGQRPADKVAFAIQMMELYPDEARAAGYALTKLPNRRADAARLVGAPFIHGLFSGA